MNYAAVYTKCNLQVKVLQVSVYTGASRVRLVAGKILSRVKLDKHKILLLGNNTS